MNKYRITVRDAKFDGTLMNPTSHSEIIECPESELDNMITCVVHDTFGYDDEILESKDLRYSVMKL